MGAPTLRGRLMHPRHALGYGYPCRGLMRGEVCREAEIHPYTPARPSAGSIRKECEGGRGAQFLLLHHRRTGLKGCIPKQLGGMGRHH